MKTKHKMNNSIIKKGWKSALSLVLAVALALGVWPAASVQMGTGVVEAAPAPMTAVADDSTADNWANLNYDASEGRTTKNDGRIWTDKSVFAGDATVQGANADITIAKEDEDAQFLVGLSALASTMAVKGVSSNPLDIVLVLDVSGSMEDPISYDPVYSSAMTTNGTYFIYRNNEYTQLSYSSNQRRWYYGDRNYIIPKTSANSSGTQVYVAGNSKMEALEDSVNAFVQSTADANKDITDTSKQHRIALVKFSGSTSNTVGNTTYVDDNHTYNHSQIVKNFATVTESNINDFNNAVAAINPAGATRADNGLNRAQAALNSARADAQKVVIFFTDGVPTTFSSWSSTVANDAIDYARTMKNNGALVYSIGVFSGSNTTNSDLNNYMNAVSSNYPSATGYTANTMGTRGEGDYYHTAANSTELSAIFETIADEIAGKVATVPTHVESGYDATKGGYITFVDKLGDYMEVKSFDSVVYEGVEYKNQISQSEWDAATGTTDVFVNDVMVTDDLGKEVSIGTIVATIERSENARTGDTITVQIPAALISLAYYDVKIENGLATTTRNATVPTRAFYEVGLKDEVRFLMASPDADMKDYMSKNTDSNGQVMFYSNAYDASVNAQDGSAVASYLPAKTNSMYFAVNDIPVFADAACTVPVTSYDANATYYYQREYYVVGEKLAPKFEVVEFRATLLNLAKYDFSGPNGQLVVKAGNGRYTREDAADIAKTTNKTSTSAKVSTPRWEGWIEGTTPVTVYLGNNGLLKATPETFKSVSGEQHVQEVVDENTKKDVTIQIEDGTTVRIGDVLTYTIRAINTEDTTATVKVTDNVPKGTEYVAGSADNGGECKDGVITWILSNMAAGEEKSVSFQVKVTEAILAADFTTVNNAANVFINDNPAYTTNTTINPPTGKTVVGSSADVSTADGVKVGDGLTYYIRYANDTDSVATVYIKDIIPAGTVYATGSISHNGTYNEKDNTVTWTMTDVQPGAVGTVSFRVLVDPSARTTIENDATIQIGENGPVYETNPTEVTVKTTNLQLTKDVVVPEGYAEDATADRQATEFTLTLKESGGTLFGEYTLLRNGVAETITFTNGTATVTIKHGDKLEIQGLIADAMFSVVETPVSGYTPTYTGLSDAGTIILSEDAANVVGVTNTYAITPAPFQLHGTKTISSETYIPDITFSFTSQVSDANGNVAAGATTVTAEADIDNVNRTANFSFSPRSFKTPTPEGQPLYYLITETATGINGVVYDTTQYLLEIVVSDNGQGVLSTDMTIKTRDNATGTFVLYDEAENAKVVFENSYVPAETQLVLEADKVLTNLDLEAGMFAFNVYAKGDATKASVTTGQNNQDGSITFRPITYKPSDLGNATSKTFTYVVEEVNSGMTGVTYDTNTFEVEVTLTNRDGQLTATAAYPQGGITFTNTYDPGEKSVTLNATKALTGERTAATAGEFSFEVKDTATDTVVASGTNDASGKVAFSAIGYTLADLGTETTKTFVYEISEIKPDVSFDPFVEYSVAKFTAEVTVSYDSASGTLNVSDPVYKDANGAVLSAVPTFTNHVNKNYVEITPAALSKSTTGNNIPAGAAFSFSVRDMNNNTVGTGVGQANGEIHFSTLSFDRIGEYNFWVEETNAGKEISGIKYDSARYLLKINVTYDATNSELVATQGYYALKAGGDKTVVADYTEPLVAPHFKNEYNANGSATVAAKKNLTGRALNPGEFSFRLTRLDNNKLTNGYMRADGNIEFASLYYTNADVPQGSTTTVIKYKMEEIIPADANKLPGVTYTNTVYYAAVTLTLNGEKIDTTVKYYTDADCTVEYTANAVPVFENTYAPKENTSTTIEVSKKLTGRTLKAGEFSFELVHVRDDGSTQVVEVATNDVNGVVKFVRTYYAATWPAGQTSMNVKYLIREVAGSLGGVEYDPQVFGMILTIVDDGTGKLTVDPNSITYYEGDTFTNAISKAEVVFENKYVAGGTSFAPVATKTLTGRTMEDNEFAFDVYEFDLATGKAGELKSTGLSKKGENVVFTPIGYSDQPGTNTITFNYVISEIKGNMGGVTYDPAKYYVAATVSDDGSGNIKVENVQYYTGYDATNKVLTGPVDAITFENEYVPTDVYVNLEATKTLSGRDLKAGEFDFEVKDESGKVVTYGTNTENGKITFGTIGYTQADLGGATEKVFKYTISEIKPSDADRTGITIDNRTFEVSVKVTDDGTGKLTAAVTYPTGGVVFNNTYKPAPVEAAFTAQKTLVNKNLNAGEFTFELSGATLTNAQLKKNDAKGLVTFDAIQFTTPGTYTFTVKEAGASAALLDDKNADGSTSKAGTYALDKSVYTVKVVVTDDYTGQLKATTTYYKDNVAADTMLFVNEYQVGKLVDVDLSDVIKASKTVKASDGIDYELKGDDFTFTVYDVSNNVISTGTNNANGEIINFATFEFTTSGQYRYWIVENPTDKPGITIDSRVWELHIQVRYDAKTGNLYVNPEDVQTFPMQRAADVREYPVFTNTYDPAPAPATVAVSKKLIGRPLADKEFVFALYEVTGNSENLIPVAEARNDAAGNVKFNFEIDTVGTHQYKVVELIPEVGDTGITYDETIVEGIKIQVTNDQTNGKLVASAASMPNDSSFENIYTPTPTTITIEANKYVKAGGASVYELEGGEFEFQLLHGDKVVSTVKNKDSGIIQFNVTYTDADMDGADQKTFDYVIKEVIPAEADRMPGMSYNTAEYKVSVTVTDDLVGALHAVVDYENDTPPTITNTYEAGSAVAIIEATKSVKAGGDSVYKLNGGEFTFQLMDGETVVAEAKNGADGKVQFSVSYTDAMMNGADKKTFDYIIKEVVPAEADRMPGMTYDTAEYEVSVTVTDDLKGALQAEVNYKNNKVPAITNAYEAALVEVTIEADKYVKTSDSADYELKGEDFTFQLLDSKNKVVAEATNGKDGIIKFNVTYTDEMMDGADEKTFEYTIKEVIPAKAKRVPGITYDEKAYEVSVTVTDDLKGALQAVVNYENDTPPTITNTYEAKSVVVTIEADKKYEGKTLHKNDFTFELVDAKGKVLASAKNNAKGDIEFKLEFKASGDYTYTLREKAGDDKDIIYDTKVYVVKVTVTDDMKGQLEAKVSYDNDKVPTFINVYNKEQDTPPTGDDTNVTLLYMLMALSATMAGVILVSKKRRRS